MKKNNIKNNKVIISPSTHLFLGLVVDKDTYLEEEKIVLPEDAGEITQHIENLVLTTKIKKRTISKERNGNDVVTDEDATLTQTLPEGTLLVYGEDTGYIVPPYNMKTIKEAMEDLEVLADI